MPIVDNPYGFLELLFQYKPEDHQVLLWTLQDKKSRWFRDIRAAADFAGSVPDRDVYIGVGLAARDYGPSRRCPAEEITGLSAFWSDLDLRSEAHPKKPLPPGIDAALSILPASMPPTVVISTGNGAHAWWVLKEPEMFENEAERKEVAGLVSRWHSMIQLNAANRGWSYDRLSDLSRVLRIPGTRNHKDPTNPKPVLIHTFTDRRYNISDFRDYLDDLAVPDPAAAEAAAREWAARFRDMPLIINPDATIPDEVLNGWIENDLRFRHTWNRQRHDMKDQSQSGYDLALACFGIDAGLNEQQIVDLIVHHRRLHGERQRRRVDYFQRTISKAADRNEPGGAAPRQATERDEGSSPNPEPADPEVQKGLLCREISTVLGVSILRILKVTGKEPTYQVVLENGSCVEFPSFEKFTDQRAVRNAIGAATNKLIPRLKPKLWEPLAQKMLDALIEKDGGEETDFRGATRMHLSHYLAETPFIPSIEGQTVQTERKPMLLQGRVAICAGDLQKYINSTAGQNLSVKAVASMLAALGAESIHVREKKARDQSRWLLPVEEFDPADYVVDSEEGELVDAEA